MKWYSSLCMNNRLDCSKVFYRINSFIPDFISVNIYYKMTDEETEKVWYCCSSCHRKYKYPTSVYNHRKFECNKEPQFECDFCKKRFTQKGSLKLHMANIHNVINWIKRFEFIILLLLTVFRSCVFRVSFFLTKSSFILSLEKRNFVLMISFYVCCLIELLLHTIIFNTLYLSICFKKYISKVIHAD